MDADSNIIYCELKMTNTRFSSIVKKFQMVLVIATLSITDIFKSNYELNLKNVSYQNIDQDFHEYVHFLNINKRIIMSEEVVERIFSNSVHCF